MLGQIQVSYCQRQPVLFPFYFALSADKGNQHALPVIIMEQAVFIFRMGGSPFFPHLFHRGRVISKVHTLTAGHNADGIRHLLVLRKLLVMDFKLYPAALDEDFLSRIFASFFLRLHVAILCFLRIHYLLFQSVLSAFLLQLVLLCGGKLKAVSFPGFFRMLLCRLSAGLSLSVLFLIFKHLRKPVVELYQVHLYA